jgi:drug/metabolite transporter (DMT)-like permease
MSSGSNSTARSKWKTPLFAFIVIFTNAFGNFFIARGMRNIPPLAAPLDLIVAIFTPWVGLGILLLITWLLSRMMFLSFADLSYMLPLTSLGYVLSAVLGHFFLNEQITPHRWAGTVLITLGMVLVGLGNPNTTPEASQEEAKEIGHAAGADSEYGAGGAVKRGAEGAFKQ